MKPASTPVLRATRLVDQVRERIRYKHYSLRTEQDYVQWVRMFVKWHSLRHPRDMGQLEIEGFLAMLANERRVVSNQREPTLRGRVTTVRCLINGRLIACTCSLRPTTRLTSTSVPTSSS